MENKKHWWDGKCAICGAKGILSDPNFHFFTAEPPHKVICVLCWKKVLGEVGTQWHDCDNPYQ